jgi:hypothetical protein
MYCSTSLQPEVDVNYPDLEFSDEVIAAVDSGHKIEAIKILREETGLGLKEAKEVIDVLARARKNESGADMGMTEEGGAGGMIKMVVIIAVILGVYFYFFAG